MPRKDYRNITWDSFKMDSGKITAKSNFNWNAFNRIQDFCPVKIIGIRVEEKTRWNLVHCYWAYKKGSSLDYYIPSEEDYEDKNYETGLTRNEKEFYTSAGVNISDKKIFRMIMKGELTKLPASMVDIKELDADVGKEKSNFVFMDIMYPVDKGIDWGIIMGRLYKIEQ